MLVSVFRCNRRLRWQISYGTAHDDGSLHKEIDIDLQLRPLTQKGMVKECGAAAPQQIKLNRPKQRVSSASVREYELVRERGTLAHDDLIHCPTQDVAGTRSPDPRRISKPKIVRAKSSPCSGSVPVEV
jgi:hypothetical protein